MLTTPEIIHETEQGRRLEEVLPRWLDRVPLYRQPAYHHRDEDSRLTQAQWLQGLPFITKNDLRHNFPHNFLAESDALDALVEQDLVELEHTSGTSEERTPLLLGRGWWKAQEETALRQNALVAKILDQQPEARRVTINSPVCNGDIRYSTLPSHEERIVGNALFVSLSRHPFLWSEIELARMGAETVAWRPVFLDVDPVYGAIFAQYCEQHGIRLPSLRFILCSYEFVSAVHRRILQRVFGVPVFNLYGSTETGHLLMENEQGEMVPSLQTAYFEVVEPDANAIGDLVITTLTNDYMPLIRYRIGDLVERHANPCRTAYVVHGRAQDSFVLPGGRRVTTLQVDDCFAAIKGITHYQLLQQADDRWLLRFVADTTGPTEKELGQLRTRLMVQLKIESGLTIEPTDLLMPESSGKFLLGYPQKSEVEARD